MCNQETKKMTPFDVDFECTLIDLYVTQLLGQFKNKLSNENFKKIVRYRKSTVESIAKQTKLAEQTVQTHRAGKKQEQTDPRRYLSKKQ